MFIFLWKIENRIFLSFNQIWILHTYILEVEKHWKETKLSTSVYFSKKFTEKRLPISRIHYYDNKTELFWFLLSSIFSLKIVLINLGLRIIFHWICKKKWNYFNLNRSELVLFCVFWIFTWNQQSTVKTQFVTAATINFSPEFTK